MRPDRWRQVESLYHSALEREEPARDAFLREVCREDEELRREVQSLLDQTESGVLSRPLRLGPYQIVGVIGAGGMGTVYQALDTRLNRLVAIKVSEARFNARFEREARAVAALNHPNICTLYDVGPNYLVMEYVDGQPLKGPLPVEDALRLAVEIAGALDAAHSHGIVHRDLKPANILVQKSGVKLLDFGLARQEPEPGASHEEIAASAITAEGAIVGTPQYMSPEQVEGKPADARSDIFAFGCVFYEMLTGAKAFDGGSKASIIAAILAREPRPVHELQPAVPPEVERVLRICLAKDPAQRWQSARDLERVLLSLAETGSEPVSTPRKVWPARLAWALVALFLAAILTLALLPWRGGSARQQAVRFGITAGEEAGELHHVYVSPDGRQMVIPSGGADGVNRLWLRALDSDQMRLIPQTEGVQSPIWSPDGKSVAFFQGGFLKRTDLTGGPPHTICAIEGRAGGGAWNTEGVIVFSSLPGPLHSVSAQGGTPRAVTRLDPAAGEETHSTPSFLPDQRRFLYTALDGRQGRPRIGSLDGNLNQALPGTGGPYRFVQPGYVLFGRDGNIMAQRFSVARLQFEGEPVRLAGPVEQYQPGTFPFTVSDNGVLAWRTGDPGTRYRLVWHDESGAALGTVGQPAMYTNPALSPDGKRLAVDIQEPGAKTRDIWVFDLARGARARFTNDPGDDYDATWSPDGLRIAFTSDRKGMRHLYVKPADGSSEEVLLFEGPGHQDAEWWSPDGRHLIYSQSEVAKENILQMLPMTPGAAPQPIPLIAGDQPSQEAQTSPNGKFIAYREITPRWSAVYVQEFPPRGPRWQVSSEYAYQPQWRRDGRALYYLEQTSRAFLPTMDVALMAVDVDTAGASFKFARPRKLFEFRSDVGHRNTYVAGPGNRLLVVEREPEQPRPPITVLVNWQAAMDRGQ